MGFPGTSAGKESACNVGDLGSIPGLGRFPGGRHDNPLQYSGLENPHGQRSLAGLQFMGSQRVGHDWAPKRAHACEGNESESHSVVSDSLRPHDYTVYGILQAGIVEWVAISFSRGSSQPADRTQIFRIAGRFFTSWTTREFHTHTRAYISIISPLVEDTMHRLLNFIFSFNTVSGETLHSSYIHVHCTTVISFCGDSKL